MRKAEVRWCPSWLTVRVSAVMSPLPYGCAGRQDEHGGRYRRAGSPGDTDYYAFPDIHRQKIRTNNPLERIMREIRRQTRVVGAFPDGQSCLNLAARDCVTSLDPHGQPNDT